MECENINELLPWYRNGSLDPVEVEVVRAHLASCDSCRQDLSDTDFAASVARVHLPTEALVARAEGAPSPLDPARVEAHLAACESCAEELAWIEEGRQAIETFDGARVVPFRRPEGVGVETPSRGVSPAWRFAAVAATLVLAVLAGALWLQRSEADRPDEVLAARPAEPAVAAVDGRGRANPVVESLYPESTVLRGGDAEEPVLRLAGDSDTLALLLVPPPDLEGAGPFAVELLDADGGVVERVEGLRLQEAGDLSLLLPASALRGDLLELRLLAPAAGGGETLVATYRRSIERPQP